MLDGVYRRRSGSLLHGVVFDILVEPAATGLWWDSSPVAGPEQNPSNSNEFRKARFITPIKGRGT
jgi:hypothetical protein